MKDTEPKGTIRLTFKAVAFVAAEEAGLIPKAKDGKIDTSAFDRFWDKFFPKLKDAGEFPDVKRLLG